MFKYNSSLDLRDALWTTEDIYIDGFNIHKKSQIIAIWDHQYIELF